MPVPGICRLCKKLADLQMSHFVARGLHKLLRQPVVMTPKIIIRHSGQLKDYLLCKKCEALFNKHGEAWIARRVWNGKEFPLLDRLNVAMPIFPSSVIAQAFSGADCGIDSEKLAYFALSILWRAAVHQWTILNHKSRLLNLGHYEERIRKYLLGKSAFPSGVAVIVTVCTDRPSQETFFVPSRMNDKAIPTFSFLILGIHFTIVLSDKMPDQMKQICCVNSDRKVLFRSSRDEFSLNAAAQLHATAKDKT
jgi:hypothetical protein